jgi:predicted small metal-binding protein
MTRKYIDCRDIPSENNCSVAISADSEEELLEAAVQHAVACHRHYNTPQLRLLIKRGIRDGAAPDAPRRPVWVKNGQVPSDPVLKFGADLR